ncbi:MAG: biopolymer transporter ExbD [Proteobacteria bacterium]|nr:biopolymer transporter ExbD [Pseudomonadota bacterium]
MAKKRLGTAEELNLVPIMNLVTILIPFLLMAAQFISLAVIDSTLPAIGPPQPPSEQEDDDPPLSLSVMITDEGFTVKGSGIDEIVGASEDEGEEAGPTIPCTVQGCPTPDTYNVAELTRMLTEIKDLPGNEDEENVILVPESRVPYEVLVLTMDSARNDPSQKVDGKSRILFPFVVIAGGA